MCCCWHGGGRERGRCARLQERSQLAAMHASRPLSMLHAGCMHAGCMHAGCSAPTGTTCACMCAWRMAHAQVVPVGMAAWGAATHRRRSSPRSPRGLGRSLSPLLFLPARFVPPCGPPCDPLSHQGSGLALSPTLVQTCGPLLRTPVPTQRGGRARAAARQQPRVAATLVSGCLTGGA